MCLYNGRSEFMMGSESGGTNPGGSKTSHDWGIRIIFITSLIILVPVAAVTLIAYDLAGVRGVVVLIISYILILILSGILWKNSRERSMNFVVRLVGSILLTLLFLGVIFIGMGLTSYQTIETISEDRVTGTAGEETNPGDTIERNVENQITNRNVITPELLALGLIPIAIFLIIFKQAGKIQVGPFSFEPFEKTLSETDYSMKPDKSDVRTLSELSSVLEHNGTKKAKDWRSTTVLELSVIYHKPAEVRIDREPEQVKELDNLTDSIIYNKLRELSNLRYVTFIDDSENLLGIISVRDFWILFFVYKVAPEFRNEEDNTEEQSIAYQIQTGNILLNSLVIRNRIDSNFTKKQALEKLNQSKYEELPVVSNGKFVGIVRRSSILSQVLLPSEKQTKEDKENSTE